MTSHWIDPTFDPLQELHDCKQEILTLKQQQFEFQHNLLQVAQAFNQHSQLVKQLLEQNRDLNDMLHGRSFRS
jgi:cell shape-determining protein MreC